MRRAAFGHTKSARWLSLRGGPVVYGSVGERSLSALAICAASVSSARARVLGSLESRSRRTHSGARWRTARMAVLILSVTIKSMQIGGPDCNPAAYREALSGYVINRLKTKIGMHRDTRLSHSPSLLVISSLALLRSWIMHAEARDLDLSAWFRKPRACGKRTGSPLTDPCSQSPRDPPRRCHRTL